MKRTRFAFILLAALVVTLPLAAAKVKLVESKWAGAQIQVDGQPAEWPAEEFVADDGRGAKFAFRNDDNYLYAFLTLSDPKYFSSIDQSGITLWINTQGKERMVYGLHFLRKTVTADQLIQDLEKQGQAMTEERKKEIKARPQYMVFACDSVNKRGEAIAHAAGVQSGTFRTALVEKAKNYEFIVPLALLDDPAGEVKVDPVKPFKVGFEWGGLTEEQKKARAAQLGDQGAQASTRATDLSSQLGGGEGASEGGAPGGSLTSLRGPKKFDLWLDLKLAAKQ